MTIINNTESSLTSKSTEQPSFSGEKRSDLKVESAWTDFQRNEPGNKPANPEGKTNDSLLSNSDLVLSNRD